MSALLTVTMVEMEKVINARAERARPCKGESHSWRERLSIRNMLKKSVLTLIAGMQGKHWSRSESCVLNRFKGCASGT